MEFFFGLFLFLIPAWAQFEVPELTAPVVDQAGMIRGDVVDELSRALKNVRAKGGPQINVLTVDSIDPLTIEEASMRVAKAWALGTGEKDDGVLLMVAKKERKVRIEVGQGLEGDLTDAYSKRIIDYDIVPAFRQGDVAAGIVGGVRGILLRMNPPLHLEDFIGASYMPAAREDTGVDLGDYKIIVILLIFFFVLWLSSLGGRGGRGGGFYGGPFIGGGGFGGFGGGGGGWSGGGGGFSGGGASGEW